MGGMSAFFLAYATHIIFYTALLKDSGPLQSRFVHTLCIWDMSVFFRINVCLQNQLFLFALIVCATYWAGKKNLCKPLIHCLDSHRQWVSHCNNTFYTHWLIYDNGNRNLWVQSLSPSFVKHLCKLCILAINELDWLNEEKMHMSRKTLHPYWPLHMQTGFLLTPA